MPELPEVEFAALCLRRWMGGRRVERVEMAPTRILRGEPPARFAGALKGRALEQVERRGKYLLLRFDAGTGLLGHLGMTGKLVRRRIGEPVRYGHVRFELDDGHAVHLSDPRKFGRLSLVEAGALGSLPEVVALGPDAHAPPLTGASLGERLGRTQRPLKVALMDQAVLAGLGNIHAAEALFRAGLDPARPANRLRPEETDRLAGAIEETIAFALSRMPAPEAEDIAYVEEGAENPFLIYGRAGQACPRCEAGLQSFVQAGRTTHWCPRCQR